MVGTATEKSKAEEKKDGTLGCVRACVRVCVFKCVKMQYFKRKSQVMKGVLE